MKNKRMKEQLIKLSVDLDTIADDEPFEIRINPKFLYECGIIETEEELRIALKEWNNFEKR